jgi:biotin carboxyl carrier protein
MKTSQKLNQSGIVHVVVIVVVAVLVGVIGYTAFRMVQKNGSNYTTENAQEKGESSTVKIKSMPVNIGTYDPVTKRAGDLVFPDQKLPEGAQPVLFSEFGYMNPGNSANGYQSQASPQPTFIVAAGTKIKSMIDGKVESVPKLYSNDYSIHIIGSGSELIFEHEHVIKPLVKAGDTVKAGQVIATASDYDAKNLLGLGVFEMGLLKGGNPPIHLCIFDYLDDTIKQDTFDSINSLKKSWEEHTGDTTLYDEASTAIPGCITRDPISDNNNSQTGKPNQ